jgi:hypothetical protein
VKSQVLLLQCVLEDSGTRCCTSTTQDFNTVLSRVGNEGFSFLTITLPQFGKDFETSLALGVVTSASFIGFKRIKEGCLPRFLSGFTSLIFDPASGRLLDEPSIAAIQCVRQISYLFSKVDLPCSDARNKAAFRKFIECEQDIREVDKTMDHDEIYRVQRLAMLLFGSVISKVDKEIYQSELIPRHGPGATADRIRGNAKYNLKSWTTRLDEVFDHSEYLYPSVSHFLESDPVDILEPGQEVPVRVVTVPKTLKTPRIIAIEPACMQYMQQSIMMPLVKYLERDDNPSRYFIGFSSQEPNQLMARTGSKYGTLATLDLSEASDRVSNQLVRALFSPYSWFSRGLDATRSRKADVPGYGVQRLAKFASMGSALCFPIEAMVFTAIVFRGIEKVLNRPLGQRDLINYVGKVRVYGDDIIVPVDCALSVVSTLEDFGLRVNLNKSFWTGKFRESCGKEYFNGFDVSVVKSRDVLPSRRRHVPEIVSAVSLRNQLSAACYERATEYLDGHIERFIPLPYVLPTSQGLGKHNLHGSYDTGRTCLYLQKPLVKAAVHTSRSPLDHLEGPGALLKWFLKQGDKPFADRDHLERAGRAESSTLKLRWVSPL